MNFNKNNFYETPLDKSMKICSNINQDNNYYYNYNDNDIEILYEDNHIISAVKPVGMLSQKDSTGNTDILNELKYYIKQKYQKPGNVFLGLVHRLDRPVGGVMVFAKTSKAASRISEQIRSRNFHKEYLAVVHGKTPLQCELKDFLHKDESTNTVYTVSSENLKSKEASLNYSRIAYDGRYSLINIELITGRPHQIRVQLSNSGYPLFGDLKYGINDKKSGKSYIALWSYRIKLTHPTKKTELVFVKKPPDIEPWNNFGDILF